MSCHKNRMTTHVKTLWCKCITSLTTSVSTMRFHIELMFILKAIKSYFKGSYYKQNLTLVVISYEIYENSPKALLLFYSILFYPITLEGRRGTTDEFATIPFHLDLFSAALVELAKSIPVHSLILSSHLFFCLPLFLFPFTFSFHVTSSKYLVL